MNIEQKINFLYDVLVDNYDILATELIDLIKQPHKIADTNRFASLLETTKDEAFIEPLLLQISLGNKSDTWLRDFLYAAINLLDDASYEDEFDMPANLINKLEDWVLNYKSELSWKAANLLRFYDSPLAEKIQLKKLEERGDFFLTYVECVLGLLNHNRDKYLSFVAEIAADETRDEKLREFCADIEP